MNVIDVKTMSPDPVAVVELPHRVPYGFHAFFVTEVSIPCFEFLLLHISKFLILLFASCLIRNNFKNRHNNDGT